MNKICDFFNKIAHTWDQNETTKKEDILPLLNVCNFKKGDKVLDLACGTGIISDLLANKNLYVTAMDLSENMINIAKNKYNLENLKFVCEDFYNTTLNGFDHVIIFNAYPHFLNKEAFIKKLYEVLNSNGVFTILHNMNREQLNNIHKEISDLSFTLSSVEEEARYFKPYFEIIKLEENDKYYLIQGKKK